MKINYRSTAIKKICVTIGTIGILVLAFVIYQKKVRYNMVTISENKVYNSGVISPDKLPSVLKENQIKTVIDFRDGIQQTELNPETKQQVNSEQYTIDKIPGVKYYNLPTDQIPQDSTVEKFLKIMDKPENYPVLIHCHHGVGRSRLFSSIYRIEYENYSNEEARSNARYLWELSGNFSKISDKGAYLLNYKKRLKSSF